MATRFLAMEEIAGSSPVSRSKNCIEKPLQNVTRTVLVTLGSLHWVL